jgi:serine/threonine protein kinase
VIRYLASFIENNELNIVLELADAGDLSKMIRHFQRHSKRIPERTIWCVGCGAVWSNTCLTMTLQEVLYSSV